MFCPIPKIKMYADDSKIIGTIKCVEDQLALQEDINRGVDWSNTWLMHFNVKKCKVMHVGNSKMRSAHVYTMDVIHWMIVVVRH